MNKIIIAVALAAVAGPALANDADVTPLYHQVTAAVGPLARDETRGPSAFTYAPLYNSVRGAADRFTGEEPMQVAGFSYSPLYLQVIMGRSI